jgi:hypothetical protein
MKDLKNQIFSRLTVLRRAENDKYGNAKWECQCICGNVIYTLGHSLRNGNTKSCGCLQKEAAKKSNVPTRFKKGRGELPDGLKRALFREYQYRAVKIGVSFEMELENFIQMINKNCFYCDHPPYNKKISFSNKNRFFMYNGIDRIDSDLGYIEGNIVPCCKACNLAKSTMKMEEFMVWIKRIYAHLIKINLIEKE